MAAPPSTHENDIAEGGQDEPTTDSAARPAPGGTTGHPEVSRRRASAARPRTPLVIKLLVTATFVVILNETIMVNAVPRLMTEFAVTPRTAQWLSTVFMLVMAAVIPVTGWFLQRVSTRRAYAIAMATFSAGTVIGAVAPVFEVLIVGRAVQAAGTAVMVPLLMTTLMTVVPEKDRGRVMGTVTLAISCAPALGPAVSGIILRVGSWRLIFGVMLPIAVAVAVAGLRQLRNVGEPQAGGISWVSVVLSAVGFGGLLFGLSEAGARDPVLVALIIAGGAALVAAFVWLQLRLQRRADTGGDGPLLDLRTVSYRGYRVSLLLMAAVHMAFLGSMFLLPLYLQNIRDLSELQTGLLVMPGGLAMGLLGPVVGRLYDQVGARPLVVPGAVLTVATLALLSRIGSDTPFALLLALHVVMMAALSAIMTPVFSVGLGALPQHLYSHGSSLFGAIMQVSGAIGTALLVVVLEAREDRLLAGDASADAAFVGGLRWAFVAAAAIAVLILVLAVRVPSRTDEQPAGAAAPAGHA
ncbi:MAG: multidrug efflux MFS transporter [Frankia sp.]|nr:multidrug efflux MFS transporter [Frankia sp.]